MEHMPFKCGQCGNWFTPVPMPEDMMCRVCAEGKHSVNKAGTYDCHWGHVTATPSEIKMATLFQQAESTRARIEQAGRDIERAKVHVAVTSALNDAEQSFAQLERGMGALSEILRWAGVKEMPGLRGEANEDRFKSLSAIEDMVRNGRRPRSDVDELQRSIKACNGMADELAGAMASVRVVLAGVRRDAEHWTPPLSEKPVLSEKPRATKAKSHRAQKRQPVGVA